MNAQYCALELRGKPSTWHVHFMRGWFEHDDGKMLSLLTRVARGSAYTARFGGMRYNVNKMTMLRPRARVLDENDPSYDKDKDYAWQTAAWMEKSASEAAKEIARLTAAGEFTQDKINEFCAKDGHAFTEGIPPYLCVRVFLWDPMHMDNNLAGSLLEQYNKLAEEMAAHFNIAYDDARSPHRKLHLAMRATGRRLGRHADALEARVRKDGEHTTFRLCGDDAIDFMISPHVFDDALALPTPFADPQNY